MYRVLFLTVPPNFQYQIEIWAKQLKKAPCICENSLHIIENCLHIIHNCQLQLQHKVETVRIGDRLTFRIEIPEKTPYGIFAR